TLNYTINYSNLSTTDGATGVEITDTVPANAVYIGGSCTGGCAFTDNGTAGGGTLIWSIASIPASGSGSFSFSARICDGSAGSPNNSCPTTSNNDQVSNTVQIFAAQAEVNTNNNTATVATTVSVTATASISGTVYNDVNNNHVVDTG